MTNQPLICIAENSALPEDEDRRQQCIEACQTALMQVFEEFDIDPNRFNIADGNLYSQVEPQCPDCGEPVRLSHFDAGPENGADATATCACGFEGRAVYRLIDIEQNLDCDSVDALFDEGSSVGEGNISVNYTPYAGVDLHFPE